MKIISYNVNGIRAAIKKGMLDWLQSANPDVFCIQETKAQQNQVDAELIKSAGYPYQYWFSAQKKGYSGVAIFCKKENQLLRGIELSINHVRGISEGFVYAKAEPIHMGRTMQLWKISIKDENQKDISFAKLTTLTISK